MTEKNESRKKRSGITIAKTEAKRQISNSKSPAESTFPWNLNL